MKQYISPTTEVNARSHPDQFFIQFSCLVKVKHDNTLLSLKGSSAHKLHSKYIRYRYIYIVPVSMCRPCDKVGT